MFFWWLNRSSCSAEVIPSLWCTLEVGEKTVRGNVSFGDGGMEKWQMPGKTRRKQPREKSILSPECEFTQ